MLEGMARLLPVLPAAPQLHPRSKRQSDDAAHASPGQADHSRAYPSAKYPAGRTCRVAACIAVHNAASGPNRDSARRPGNAAACGTRRDAARRPRDASTCLTGRDAARPFGHIALEFRSRRDA